jgi:hypothetical protein
MIDKARATAALMLTAVVVTTSCSGKGSSGSSSPAGSSAVVTSSSSRASQSTTFTSGKYGYAVTLPPGWTGTQAAEKWDVHAGFGLNSESFTADQFRSPSDTPVSSAVATHWKGDLAAWARLWIVATDRYHESCPPKPNTRNSVSIGGQPGLLLAYNCGILVNMAVTVHRGVAYNFTLVDDSVPAATGPTDHATFLNMLKSVRFSG